jgi:hypothetical protein
MRKSWKSWGLLTASLLPLLATALSAGERPRVGDNVVLRFGQMTVIDMALTAENYGEFTKCMDRPGSIHCVAGLLHAQKIVQVTRGTRVRVLAYHENPYHAKVLTGELVQVRILEPGPLRDKSLWTLEDRIER